MIIRSIHMFVLPAIHLLICLVIAVGLIPTEGAWMWFPVFFLDFPFSILLLPLLDTTNPLLVFGILGTLWWYILSILLALLFRGIYKAVRKWS